MATVSSGMDDILLPLRENLQLLPGPTLEGGSPTWTLHDPPKNQFFRIGRLEFEALARWSNIARGNVTAQQVADTINSQTSIHTNREEIQTLHSFFTYNCLLAPGNPVSTAMINSRRNKKTHPLLWLVRNYLFLRIPLIKPDRFLDATLPAAKILASKPVQYLFLVMAVLSIYLVSRQWQSFLNTFAYFFSFEGLFYYTAALVFVKILHELGHAYTAKYYGIRVPTLGLAFIVLFPMLFTDTTESWKLTDRKARMKIVGAGIAVEIALALIATFLWCFIADGPLRSACFIVATVTWITSLFMNISPFMRFDGYYLLSDYLDIPNLQTRAFNLGKWYLRDMMIGLKAPCPESLRSSRVTLLIAYAYGTWIYRVILFTGIALVVYHMFFKILGLILFSVEIIWFILLPIIQELHSWWEKRSEVGLVNRNLLGSFTLLTLFCSLFFVAWNSHIYVRCVVLPKERHQLFPPISAQISKIHVVNNQLVAKGDLLFSLNDPLLSLKEQRALKNIEVLEVQLQRQIAKSELITSRKMLQSQLIQAHTEIDGYAKQAQRLKIIAPISGRFVDLDETLSVNQWINPSHLLGQIVDQAEFHLEGYLKGDELTNIDLGNKGLFYPDNQTGDPLPVTLTSVEPLNKKILDEPYLASVYGGDIAVTFSAERNLISHGSFYRMHLDLPESTDFNRVVRGRLVLNGKAISLYERAKRNVLAVLIRESGF
nr:HlyD family efflux transporter periplasmic adaptor subunit [Desulfobulbaceae bacterium]